MFSKTRITLTYCLSRKHRLYLGTNPGKYKVQMEAILQALHILHTMNWRTRNDIVLQVGLLHTKICPEILLTILLYFWHDIYTKYVCTHWHNIRMKGLFKVANLGFLHFTCRSFKGVSYNLLILAYLCMQLHTLLEKFRVLKCIHASPSYSGAVLKDIKKKGAVSAQLTWATRAGNPQCNVPTKKQNIHG